MQDVEGSNSVLVASSLATFNIQIKLDTSRLDGLVLAPGNNVAWRVKFCDANRIGFCTPFRRQDGQPVEDMTFVEDDVSDDNNNTTTKPDVLPNELIEPLWFAAPLELGDFPYSGELNGNGNTDLVLSSTVTYEIPEDTTGTYYAIGHAVLLLGPNENSASVQLDVANALPRRIFSVIPPPRVLQPTEAYKIGISILLGVVGAFELLLLVGVVVYRKNGVMKLSQPAFLSLMVLCALLASLSCILYIPENDLYCNLWSPLIMIPVSTIASILIARIWRMYIILSSSLRLSLIAPKKRVHEEKFMSALTFLASWHESLHEQCVTRLHKSPPTHRQRSLSVMQHSLRKEVKDRHVLQLIATLTAPQVIVQVIALTLYPAWVDVAVNDGVARVVCEADHWWPIFASFLIVVLLFLMSLLVAWISRDLPSLFNEKKQVFKASWINFLVVAFAGAMIILTDFETTSPNTRAFLFTAVTLCAALTPCFYVVLPKVLRARKGETLVMSRLFTPAAGGSSSFTHQGFRPDDGSSSNITPSPRDAEEGAKTSTTKKEKQHVVVIREFEPPPRQLEYQLLAMKDLLTKMNDSSTEGRRITKQEWELLQDSSDALNSHLKLLEFDWDDTTDDSHDEQRQHYKESMAEVFSTSD